MPYLLSRLAGKSGYEIFNQQTNVFSPLAQRRNVDRKHIDAVEQIAAESAVRNGGRQISVGGSNYPYISADGAAAAHALKLSFLQHA